MAEMEGRPNVAGSEHTLIKMRGMRSSARVLPINAVQEEVDRLRHAITKLEKKKGPKSLKQSELALFAANGDLASVTHTLDESKFPLLDMASIDHNGWTPLHEAAVAGHWDVVALMLERGADIAVVNLEGNTPFHYLCGTPLPYDDRWLHCPLDPQFFDIHAAPVPIIPEILTQDDLQIRRNEVRRGSVATASPSSSSSSSSSRNDSVRSRRKSFSSPSHDGDILPPISATATIPVSPSKPSYRMSISNFLSSVKRNKADAKKLSASAPIKDALSASRKAERLNLRELDVLTKALRSQLSTSDQLKPFLNQPNCLGETPLHRAARRGSPFIVNFLLRSGCLVNVFTLNGATPLHIAIQANRPEIVQLLLEYQADLRLSVPPGISCVDLASRLPPESPIHFALAGGINCLSDELLLKIFSEFVNPKEIAVLAKVSKRFNRLTSLNVLWHNVFEMYGYRPERTWSSDRLIVKEDALKTEWNHKMMNMGRIVNRYGLRSRELCDFFLNPPAKTWISPTQLPVPLPLISKDASSNSQSTAPLSPTSTSSNPLSSSTSSPSSSSSSSAGSNSPVLVSLGHERLSAAEGSDHDFWLKIAIVGGAQTGISSFAHSFLKHEFKEGNKFDDWPKHSPIIVGMKQGVQPRRIKLQIVERPPLKSIRNYNFNWFKDSDGIILLFDLSRLTSISEVYEWGKHLDMLGYADLPVIAVGNKNDLTPEVSPQQIKEVIEKFGWVYSEASCKTGFGVMFSIKAMVDLAFESFMGRGGLRFKPQTKMSKQPESCGFM